jgi:hypothetical protein
MTTFSNTLWLKNRNGYKESTIIINIIAEYESLGGLKVSLFSYPLDPVVTLHVHECVLGITGIIRSQA